MSFILTIEKLVWRGRGLARLPGGKVVMLDPGGLPGETVRARITTEKKDHAQAVVEDILAPCPERRPHPCPHGSVCGGSVFGVLPYAVQLGMKRDILDDCLARSLPPGTVRKASESMKLFSSPSHWSYRWRAQVQVRSGIPHYRKQSSHELFPITSCLLLAKPLMDSLHELCEELPDSRATLAASPADARARHHLDPSTIRLPFRNLPLTLELRAQAFFQANWELNQDLIAYVSTCLDDQKKTLDLFAGSGNFALPLALQGKRVLGIESSDPAVSAAKKAADQARANDATFLCDDLNRPQAWNAARDFAPDSAVVDPPRAGGGKAVQELLHITSLERLVWVSCDVVNTCRDLRPFLDSGWRVTSIALFDMFPQTWHMEVVFVLDR